VRILELGNYVVPAYAGMILAEQGHEIVKWVGDSDPIQGLNHGAALWEWINHGKALVKHSARFVPEALDQFDAVIDNFRPATLERFGLDPAHLAATFGVRWVSMRADVGEVSFDALAQMRAWGDHAPYMPFYIGDTSAGLWLAFKLLASKECGHFTLFQATCLAKLVEGEMVVAVERDGKRVPWDRDLYDYSEENGVVIEYRDVVYRETPRDDAWRAEHLRHRDGRYVI
jgi:hypothetical protein